MKRIRGLSALIGALAVACKFIRAFGPGIRHFVPAERLTDYDDALAQILAACLVVESIDYLDQTAGTNAPWGL